MHVARRRSVSGKARISCSEKVEAVEAVKVGEGKSLSGSRAPFRLRRVECKGHITCWSVRAKEWRKVQEELRELPS